MTAYVLSETDDTPRDASMIAGVVSVGHDPRPPPRGQMPDRVTLRPAIRANAGMAGGTAANMLEVLGRFDRNR